MRKKILLALFLVYSFFFSSQQVFSAENCDQISDQGKKQECLNNLIVELQQNINTYNGQIQLVKTQVALTESRILQTQDKIANTQKEIDILGSRIEGLDTSLTYLSKLLLERVVQGYKQRSVSIFKLLFDSDNASDFISKMKYQKTAQENNQKLLVQVEQTKLNFEEQKKLREEKKTELDNLKATLAQQQTDLENQQATLNRLLAVTETQLANARAELAAFSRFAQAAGGGLTSFGSGSNGWFYTQRDPQWGNMILPGSSSSVMLAGCAVTSVAMVCKSYGQGITPASIASNPGNFIGGDLWNWAFNCSGKTTDWIGNSQDQVKSYVKNGTPVILRLIEPSVSGLHFIVAFGWDDGKSDFKIHDPYYGPDKYFSDRYSWSQVTTAIAIH